jgi:hypothetical protein
MNPDDPEERKAAFADRDNMLAVIIDGADQQQVAVLTDKIWDVIRAEPDLMSVLPSLCIVLGQMAALITEREDARMPLMLAMMKMIKQADELARALGPVTEQRMQ